MKTFKKLLKSLMAIIAILLIVASILMFFNSSSDLATIYAAIGCLLSAVTFGVIWSVMDNQETIIENQDKLSKNQTVIYELIKEKQNNE